MYQAISTKFLGPTNARGSRIKATAAAGSVTVSWNYALSPEQNHTAAARALATKWGWSGTYIGGSNPSGDGYTFVSTRNAEHLAAGAFTV